MKKIQLIQLQKPDKRAIWKKQKRWNVFLGNGVKRSFSNRKEAARLLADINRELNFSLILVNEIYLDLFTWYRRAWFYFGGPSLTSTEGQIKDAFAQVDRLFNILVDRAGLVNGNIFAFKHIFSIIDLLHTVALSLADEQKSRGNYAAGSVIRIISDRLTFEKRRLEKLAYEGVS